MNHHIKVLLNIFNYSVNKLSNLKWSFLIIDSSWINKTPIISTDTFRMVINLSKDFLQNQLFFIAWNQKQMLFVLGKIGSREAKVLNFKKSTKTFSQDRKAIPNYKSSVTLCNLFLSIPSIPTYWHQAKPLGCKEFPEPSYLLKWYVYIVAYFGIRSEIYWHIPECN